MYRYLQPDRGDLFRWERITARIVRRKSYIYPDHLFAVEENEVPCIKPLYARIRLCTCLVVHEWLSALKFRRHGSWTPQEGS